MAWVCYLIMQWVDWKIRTPSFYKFIFFKLKLVKVVVNYWPTKLIYTRKKALRMQWRTKIARSVHTYAFIVSSYNVAISISVKMSHLLVKTLLTIKFKIKHRKYHQRLTFRVHIRNAKYTSKYFKKLDN